MSVLRGRPNCAVIGVATHYDHSARRVAPDASRSSTAGAVRTLGMPPDDPRSSDRSARQCAGRQSASEDSGAALTCAARQQLRQGLCALATALGLA